MPITDQSERLILGSGLFAVAGSLAALAAVLGAMSLNHMAVSATICGSSPGHCLTCIGALACLGAALAAGGAGLTLLRPRRPGSVAC